LKDPESHRIDLCGGFRVTIYVFLFIPVSAEPGDVSLLRRKGLMLTPDDLAQPVNCVASVSVCSVCGWPKIRTLAYAVIRQCQGEGWDCSEWAED